MGAGMRDIDKVIKILESQIKKADKTFKKYFEIDNYAQMAVIDAYQDGLQQALQIVIACREEK